MCGIAGAITWGNGPKDALNGFDIGKLAYRGPDARCTLDSSEIARPPAEIRWKLAHARLSILDLAESANQPMASADERYWLVFNGEIYNHRSLRTELEGMGLTFRTNHSDSEVLLNACIAWGTEALTRLNGMFAFVLVDNLTGKVWGARDRMGIKPFYYKKEGTTFTFASEPKAILGNRTVNRDAILQYFRFLQVEGERTFYEGISKLPAAHYFQIDPEGNMRIQRYWHPLQGNTGRDLTDVSGCFDLLKEAVELQMEADVEVGTYLSGGLDSSIITALASRDRQVSAFSVTRERSTASRQGWRSARSYLQQPDQSSHQRSVVARRSAGSQRRSAGRCEGCHVSANGISAPSPTVKSPKVRISRPSSATGVRNSTASGPATARSP